MKYYEVAPNQIVRQNSPTFTYSHPEAIEKGQLVHIEVAKKNMLGLVIKSVPKPPYDTKPISDLLDIEPLPLPLVDTALWMSEYYATHLATVLQTVLPRGLDKKRRDAPDAKPAFARKRTHFLLNTQQSSAVDSVLNMSPGTAILHGITGSGKTAVYIELARKIVASGKSAIVLIPEIALSSQIVSEFSEHFKNIVLTHSGQTEAERHRAWQRVSNSYEPQIIIGPRSALFMPIKNIGLIVIDEAHEPSFKQDQSPRYSALRVASVLSHNHEAKVVQGTATPLMSEYYTAKHTNRPIIRMDKVAQLNAAASKLSLVDLTKRQNPGKHHLFSDLLIESMSATFASGNQALIFHNRRGSASTTLCDNCGWSALCPTCQVPFTLHADLHSLRCHICGKTDRVPTSCPLCHSTNIIHKGIGTKLIESELKKLFPQQTIARFDGDVDSGDTLEKRYQDLYEGNIDIIIGTQVVAKGLDLPKLRLVGIVQADAGLSLPDFSSSERTFQLISQVIGRVGRSSHPTNVIIQSYQPTHPAIALGIKQDYDSFYQQMISERQKTGFPPFSFILKLTCVYATEATSIKNSQKLASEIRSKYPNLKVLGPTPAFYEHVRSGYRWQIVIKSKKRADLLGVLGILPKAHWQYDIDPYSLL